MEITRRILLFLILHLSTFYCDANVTSFKQKKKASTKPHGRHVANKSGWSILFDPHGGNKTVTSVSPLAVVNIKGSPHEQQSRIESAYLMKNILEEKKRRKRKRKLLRKQNKIWREQKNLYQKPHPKRHCRNWRECKKDECCIRYSSTNGYCKKKPQKGQRCKPFLLPGLRDCPCDQGLTCARYKTTRWGLQKHRCQRLLAPDDEVEQRYV